MHGPEVVSLDNKVHWNHDAGDYLARSNRLMVTFGEGQHKVSGKANSVVGYDRGTTFSFKSVLRETCLAVLYLEATFPVPLFNASKKGVDVAGPDLPLMLHN